MTVEAPAARSGLAPAVWRALGTVRDPELDESITDLKFVQECTVSGDEVTVVLRLPTYFCAPNFAYLMVADAADAVRGLPGVRAAHVTLAEHFASDEINAGVAAGGGFSASFPGLADPDAVDLADLRVTFQRKAHSAAQELVADGLLRAGHTLDDLLGTTLGQAPEGPALDRLRRRRADLRLPAGPSAPLLLDPDGTPMTADGLPLKLRLARTTRVSIEGNGIFCRGLLATRYGDEG
ncbi:iron-sulfur cluster assembly protein [Pseudonocardia sp. MH-G8]|uniref:iron-sulfur cluster assembly protein n=1 Tax=Pseudonocardia sp. MH-G8 TaxID=1854588 RepID=UPI001E34610E|nr:iron-sulfur cluster assembly protein [Pseudonocardia sp. MH-G8]